MTDLEAAGRLALALARVNRRLRSVDGGLSHGLLSALATVNKVGPVRPAELAHREAVSAPNATRLVAELESQGLVSRSVDPEDGRAVLIEVTPAGTEMILRARSARAALVDNLLGQLAPENAAAIVAALPALEALAEEALASVD